MSENKKYYVIMTDKVLSGWGKADGKVNKLIFECDSYEQAKIVEENAKSRSDMKYVNINSKKPSYDSNNYYVQEYTPNGEYANWYKKDAFK